MTTIDLITGFLGAGKTTFITQYVRLLMEQGLRVCILENDFGAVNIDRMLVEQLGCDIEMVAGGCDYDCHRRRFRTKLIAMGMLGYDRVIVEPSGIYDVDEFYDALQEEPLDRWYTIGSVIALVDARLPEALSAESDYLLASEAATAGAIVFSHCSAVPGNVLEHLNRACAAIRCRRQFTEAEARTFDGGPLSPEDLSFLTSCGYRPEAYEKQQLMDENGYDTLYLMQRTMTPEILKECVARLFADLAYGHVIRVKGFLKTDAGWLELNATQEQMDLRPSAAGQEVLIVIGEELKEPAVAALFP